MPARNSIRRLRRHGVYLFVYGVFTFCVQRGTAQIQRPLKLNLHDTSVVRRTEPAPASAKARADMPANLTAPTVLQIAGDVYEYNFILPTGTGQYHSIGVHRVVRVNNGKPIVSRNSVFLAHGYSSDFNSFMGGIHSPQSLPAYLARNGIDVWGIDYGWTLVPSTETNFTFMQNWGLQRDIDDLEAAISFARIVRSATGSDGGRMNLLGWSGSVWTGFALLNEESHRSCALRQAKGFVPVDQPFKTINPDGVAAFCGGEALFRQYIAQGFYDDDAGFFYQILANLAQTDPNGISPPYLLPPYTNLAAFLVFWAAPWQLGPGDFPAYVHYYAGTFGPAGINEVPTGLQYTNLSRAEENVMNVPPFQPVLQEAEGYSIACGDANPRFDDNLKAIGVPVLYVGAAGGEGSEGLYALTLLGSKDVQSFVVRFYPPDQAALDFAHIDLFDADNAQEVVWNRILDWLKNHQDDTSCSE